MIETPQWTPTTPYDDHTSQETPDQLSEFMEDRLRAVEAYAQANPWSFGMWMLGIGFVLGWKLKPW